MWPDIDFVLLLFDFVDKRKFLQPAAAEKVFTGIVDSRSWLQR